MSEMLQGILIAFSMFVLAGIMIELGLIDVDTKYSGWEGKKQ